MSARTGSVEPADNKPSKSELTRGKIIDTALQLFTENGYEQTTMRAIAKAAGVSVGNAYYYFDSKEALVQGYYEGLFESFDARTQVVLDTETRFSDRLTSVLLEWVDNARDHHRFAGEFFNVAANPKSSVSPFSPESAPARDASIDLMRRLIEGSKRLKVADELRHELPRLLWLFEMGIVLFWVYDISPNQERTRTLIRRSVPMIEKLLGLSRLPVLRSTTRDVMQLLEQLLPDR